MQNTNEKLLKVFKGFKQELEDKIHELQSKTFTVRWKNVNGVELEIACDEDMDEAFTSLQSCHVYLTTVPVPPLKEVQKEPLPMISKNSQVLSELLNEVSSLLQSDDDGLKVQFLNWFGNNVGMKSNNGDQYFRTCEGLAQLQQMGFQDNTAHLINLLDRYHGNVMAVANILRM